MLTNQNNNSRSGVAQDSFPSGPAVIESQHNRPLLSQYLIENSTKYHPQIGSGMCNHFSMAMQSLAELGASDDRLRDFFQEAQYHRQRLSPESTKSLGLTIDDSNWTQFFGQREYLGAYKRFFTQIAQKLSREDLIRKYTPPLFYGMWKGLYHPIIRTYFGLLHEDITHTIDGLAYWAIRFAPICDAEDLSLFALDQIDVDLTSNNTETINNNSLLKGALPHQNKSDSVTLPDLKQVLGSLITSYELSNPTSTFSDVSALLHTSSFLRAALRPFPSHIFSNNTKNQNAFLFEMCKIATALYKTAPALTTLHATTGIQAFASIIGLVEDRVVPLRLMWVWLAALCIEKGVGVDRIFVFEKEQPRESNQENSPVEQKELAKQAWATVAQEAAKSDHVHLLKLVFSLQTMAALWPHCDFFLTAAKFVVQRGNPW